jgi:hypothetical protein
MHEGNTYDFSTFKCSNMYNLQTNWSGLLSGKQQYMQLITLITHYTLTKI